MGAEAYLLLALALPTRAPTKVEASEWIVTAHSVGRVLRGSPAHVEMEVTSRAGFHLNDDYPLNFKPKPSSAAKFERPRIDRGDGITFETCQSDPAHRCLAHIPVTFTPTVVGEMEVSGTLAFSVCDPDRCLIKKIELTVPVLVSKS